MKKKQRMKGNITEPSLFLFIIAVVAYILGINQPLNIYPLVNVTNTSSGYSYSTSTSNFALQAGTMMTITAAAVALAYFFSGDRTIIILSAFAGFMLSAFASLPISIFSDPSIPFPVQLILGGSLSIIIIFAVIEFFSGRFRT